MKSLVKKIFIHASLNGYKGDEHELTDNYLNINFKIFKT